MHGEGTFFVKGQDGTYKLAGEWNHGAPTLSSNKYALEIIAPAKEEEDPKAKKDPKKQVSPEDEECGTCNEIKLSIDTANSVEANRTLSLELKVQFQGEPYEDPNPPEEDEGAKKKGGKKDVAAEPEVRMITPEPILLEKESGRIFEVELGRYETVRIKESAPTLEHEASGKELASNADDGNESIKTEKVW